MAEFGTFAAALQIAETVFKLRKLWSDIRHALEDLDDLAEEVILHAELLGGLRRQTSILTIRASDETWDKCHRLFEKCVVSLQVLVDELGSIKQVHPRTASIRLYLRRDELKKCRERMQRAQAVMGLAQQAYSIAISTCYGALILDELRQLQQPPRRLIANARHQTKQYHSRAQRSSNTAKPKSFVERNHHSSGTNYCSLTYPRSRSGPSISFHFPTWTVWKCVHIWSHYSSRSFGINFRIYNTRPNDSDLFRFSRNGDWTEVRHMLANRVASPFDVDEWGTTLLHIAASQARPDMCRFLMGQGLDASCRTWQDNKTPLETLTLAFRPLHEDEPRSNASLNTAQLLLGDAVADYASEPKHWLFRCSLPSSVLLVLIAAVIPNYNSIPSPVRAKIALATTSSDPESITVLLGPDLSLQQAFKLVTTKRIEGYGHRQLLFNASRWLAKLDQHDKRRRGWLSVIKAIISFEQQNQSLLRTCGSRFRSLYMHYIAFHIWAHSLRSSKRPLSSSAHKSESTWNDTLTTIGKIWLEILVSCGADLERYSKAEKSTLAHAETIILRRRRKDKSSTIMGERPWCFRLKFMTCGKHVDDWKVYVVPTVHVYRRACRPGHYCIVVEGHEEYEMVGEFWHCVENPELFGVPGSFLGGEGEYGGCGGKRELTMGRSVPVRGPVF